MRHSLFPLLLCLLAATGSSRAEVAQSDASTMQVTQRVVVPTDARTSYRNLIHPERWWSSQHTWSGKAGNLRLDPRAGGCWCERWPGAEAEHGRVIFIEQDKRLRVQGAFGPLQAMGLNGVLDFQLTQGKDGTQIDLSYRISGGAASKLDAIAPAVDKVMAEQMAGLKALLDQQGQAARR